MREFSEFEKRVIVENLIPGSGLSHCFLKEFRENIQIIITAKSDHKYAFEFRCKVTFSGNQVQDTLIDVVSLLGFLLKEGLIRTYYPAFTDLEGDKYDVQKRFEAKEQISLGEPQEGESMEFIIADGANEIADFVFSNHNNRFRATEPLRSLVNHEFKYLEVRMHEQNLERAIESNKTARIVGFGSILVALGSIVGTCMQGKSNDTLIERMISNQELFQRHVHNDSTILESIKSENKKIGENVDSLETTLREKLGRVDSIVGVLRKSIARKNNPKK